MFLACIERRLGTIRGGAITRALLILVVVLTLPAVRNRVGRARIASMPHMMARRVWADVSSQGWRELKSQPGKNVSISRPAKGAKDQIETPMAEIALLSNPNIRPLYHLKIPSPKESSADPQA